jgi:hypothetical protein
MSHVYAVLERPPAGDARADYFRQAFGALHVPLIDDEVVLFQAAGEKEAKQRYKAAVFSTPALRGRFVTSCMVRKDGQRVLDLALACGFYPVNVDGIIVVRSDRPLFGSAAQ